MDSASVEHIEEEQLLLLGGQKVANISPSGFGLLATSLVLPPDPFPPSSHVAALGVMVDHEVCVCVCFCCVSGAVRSDC